ncbi:hypothetical protein BZG35_08360 [Brevundimonas sp. LM2]|nr:hypothetical protein BZG35_08360 [Brevundimonas sp. LM2]
MPSRPHPLSATARRARQARRWRVRLDRGDLRPAERQRLQAWLADDANARAYQAVDALWLDLDAAPALGPQAAALRRWSPRAAALSARGRPRALAAGLVAATVAAVAFGPGLGRALQTDARAGVGEQRTVTLDDGSRLVLDTGAAVDVVYAGDRRAVRLLSGRALFTVAPDPSRPFVVSASGGTVTALGTVFVVQTRPLADGGGARVTGVDHRIRAVAGGSTRDLGPGQTVAWTWGRAVSAVAAATDPNAAGWTDGSLEFEGEPLAAIAAELDPYARERLMVLGSARELKVSGVFRTRDPLGGLMALDRKRGLRVHRLPGLVVVRAD